MALEPKKVAEMIGEMPREAAVLVAVFVPLDVILAVKFSLDWKDTIPITESAIFARGILGLLGVVIERKRQP